jgi:hypothetical protein
MSKLANGLDQSLLPTTTLTILPHVHYSYQDKRFDFSPTTCKIAENAQL